MLPDGGEITSHRVLVADELSGSERHRRAIATFPWNFADVSVSLDTVARGGYRSDFEDSEDNSDSSAINGRVRRQLGRRRRDQRRHTWNKPCIISESDRSYVPSWLTDKASDDMDASSHSNVKDMNTTLSDFLSVVDDGSNDAKQSQTAVDASRKDHSELEKEYLKLRKRITRRSSDSDGLNKSQLNNRTFSDRLSEISGSQTDVPDTRAFFSSDELGINHFRKHIHNVKSTSKKYKRTLRKTEQKNKRVHSFKPFKTLYEQEHSSMGESTNVFSHLTPMYGDTNFV